MLGVIEFIALAIACGDDGTAVRLPDGWNDSPKRLQQKDLDARWVKKLISITIVIRTAFAWMLSTVVSDAL